MYLTNTWAHSFLLSLDNIRFNPSSYSVNESTETLDLTLTLDKALSDKLLVDVNWEYNRGTTGKRESFTYSNCIYIFCICVC